MLVQHQVTLFASKKWHHHTHDKSLQETILWSYQQRPTLQMVFLTSPILFYPSPGFYVNLFQFTLQSIMRLGNGLLMIGSRISLCVKNGKSSILAVWHSSSFVMIRIVTKVNHEIVSEKQNVVEISTCLFFKYSAVTHRVTMYSTCLHRVLNKCWRLVTCNQDFFLLWAREWRKKWPWKRNDRPGCWVLSHLIHMKQCIHCKLWGKRCFCT